jgi:hypothetical protein
MSEEAISIFAEFEHALASGTFLLRDGAPISSGTELTTRHVLPVIASGSPGTATGNYMVIHEPMH